MRPISDLELYRIAADMGSEIAEYLNAQYYEKSGIQLSIRWSTASGIGASASVWPSMDAPSHHIIEITYEFLTVIYAQALDFAMFAMGKKGEAHHLGIHMLPSRFDMFEAAELMYQFGLSFVIFHELGHLNQNHGAIRAKYSNAPVNLTLNEFGISAGGKFTGELAAIFHATELAADYEALDWMASFLQVQYSGEEYYDLAYMQCASVSFIMLVFNGDEPVRFDKEPTGSHPYPVIRMDLWMQAYYERLVITSGRLGIDAPKADIHKRFCDAAYMALMKWMTRLQLPDEPQYTGHTLGATTHPNFKEYMHAVVGIWSRECEDALASRKFGTPLGVAYYTDELRAVIGVESNTYTFLEHLERCSSAVRENNAGLQ
ncbi:hypothetical protein HU750_15905 [Pseudomonas sp. SWRI50]|uniref:hypothetical protein n=1 Tax=Pseudomonas sp. SWRI50 TaxID=2745484 RepID=UPI001646219A|nr:hypothetical protein [Pseudomonas sp. SWRI50]MBC3487156.1 hypothetical protein [Pseudomonas sp. SWRI50]